VEVEQVVVAAGELPGPVVAVLPAVVGAGSVEEGLVEAVVEEQAVVVLAVVAVAVPPAPAVVAAAAFVVFVVVASAFASPYRPSVCSTRLSLSPVRPERLRGGPLSRDVRLDRAKIGHDRRTY
jgi:hypothetical protein